MGLKFRESHRQRGPGSTEAPPSCCQGPGGPGSPSAPRGGSGEGPGGEALGALYLRDRKEDAAPGCGFQSGAGPVSNSCTVHTPGTWGIPCPAWALGLWGCPHQGLSNPPRLLCLGQLLELFPLQEVCTSEEGFTRGLQSSRSWEMAPQLEKETWHPPPLGKAASCSQLVMGRGCCGQSLNWV